MMTTVTIADAKKADKETKALIFGFVRIIQTEFKSDTIDTIPPEIIYLQ